MAGRQTAMSNQPPSLASTPTQPSAKVIARRLVGHWASVLWLIAWAYYLSSQDIPAKATVLTRPFAVFVVLLSALSLAAVLLFTLRVFRRLPVSAGAAALLTILLAIASVPFIIAVAMAMTITWAWHF